MTPLQRLRHLATCRNRNSTYAQKIKAILDTMPHTAPIETVEIAVDGFMYRLKINGQLTGDLVVGGLQARAVKDWLLANKSLISLNAPLNPDNKV